MATKEFTILADIGTDVYFEYKNDVIARPVADINISYGVETTMLYAVVVEYHETDAGTIKVWLDNKHVFLTADEVSLD